MDIRVAGTENDSIVDGWGIRFTLFVQGCPHNCDGCHNKQTHDFNGGYIIDTNDILNIIKQNPLLDGVTFSGGEPFCKVKELSELGKSIKSLGLNLITYTGYTFEYLYSHYNEYKALLEVTDILIDGKFMKELQSYDLTFVGSSNQRIIDMKKSLESGIATIYER